MKELIKKIYENVLSLYKDFFHWNIAKICIEIWSFVLGIILSLPFFFVLVIFGFLDSIPWISYYLNGVESTAELANQIRENVVYVIIEGILFLIAITFLILGWSYKALLRVKLVKEYYHQNSFFHKLFEGAKRKLFGVHIFKPSIYKAYFSFDTKVFSCYVRLVGWVSLYLLIPFLVFIMSVLGVILAYKGDIEALATKFIESPINSLSIFIFVSFLLSVFLFIYIIYRVYFSLMVMVDHAEKLDYKNAKNLVRESFSMTKGAKSFFTFVGVYLVFGLVMLPFIFVSIYTGDKKNDLVVYKTMKEKSLSPDTDKTFNQDLYTRLTLKYGEMEQNEIQKELEKVTYFEVIYSLFMFLIFTGYFDMVFFSLYKNYFEKRDEFNN